MNYKEIQNMRKQAAPAWLQRIGIGKSKEAPEPIDPEIHGRLYDNLEDFKAAGFGNDLSQIQQLKGNAPRPSIFGLPSGSPETGHIPFTYERYSGQKPAENKGIMQRFGDSVSTGWNKLLGRGEAEQSTQAKPAQEPPLNAWRYNIYPTGKAVSNAAEGNTAVSKIIHPEELPDNIFGGAMIKVMNEPKPDDLKSSTAVPHWQPLTAKQWMSFQAGDPGYWDKLLEHLRSIDPKYWHEGNLALSDDRELAALADAVPATAFGSRYPNYNMMTGEITPFSEDALMAAQKAHGKGSGASKPVAARPSTMPSLYNPAHTPAAMAASAAGHEYNHWLSTGTLKLVMEPYPHFETVPMGAEGQNWWTKGHPAMMRQERPTPLYFTPIQQEWLKKHKIEPYAIDDVEMNQALMDFNQGRYRLRKHMLENPDNLNYGDLSPELRQQFADLPQMIQGGAAGREELDRVMSFYNQNPQFIPLMSEQSRLVGYYDNLKAAIENSTDPAEKMFFQNLMDRFIYNKSYLADNQRPSYTDVQRMMA